MIDNTPVSWDYMYVGKCNLKESPSCNIYSGSWPHTNDPNYIAEEMWRGFPKKATDNYKKYISSGETVSINGKSYNKNISGLYDSLYTDLLADDNKSIGLFPCITQAEVTGFSDRLEYYLFDAPLLTSLRLKKTDSTYVDLSNTHLDYVELNVTGVKRLILPHTIRCLKIYGEIDDSLQINDKRCIDKISLIIVPDKDCIFRYGLENVHIKSLILAGLNDFDELDFDSVPKEAGRYLKKKWNNKLEKLSIAHLRDNNWLKENLDNPLRHWDDNEFIPQTAYKKAVKCYKDIRKLFLKAEWREQIENAVSDYTVFFNELNQKFDLFIETDEREDIFETMEQLYNECISDDIITWNEVETIMETIRNGW